MVGSIKVNDDIIILNCPFCDADFEDLNIVKMGRYYCHLCPSCGADGPPVSRKKDVLKAWNTRHGNWTNYLTRASE